MSWNVALEPARRLLLVAVAVAAFPLAGVGAAAAAKPHAAPPDFGPNVKIFDPSMPTSQIQATVDAIAGQQVRTSSGRSATRCCSSPAPTARPPNPLNFQVGYYTSVAGLGRLAGRRRHQRLGLRPQPVRRRQLLYRAQQLLALAVEPDDQRDQARLRLLQPASSGRCRRPRRCGGSTSTGRPTLMDYCTGPSFASGGFIADSQFDGSRRSTARSSSGWSATASSTAGRNGVWNQVFSGVVGAPAQCFPALPNVCGPYTTLADQPGDPGGAVPVRRRERAATRCSCPRRSATPSGTTWGSGPTPGTSIPLDEFFVAKPTRRRAGDQQRAGPGPEPALHPRRLPPRQDDQGQAGRHRRARARLRRRSSRPTATSR